MVDDHGNRTPVYNTHAAYYCQARELVAAYISEHGRPPTREELGRAALALPALAP